jgi:diaminopimelate decarboxylase/ribosomal protein S18 acetylase RimI-like enzyme
MMPGPGLRAALAAAGTDRLVYDLTGIEEHYDRLVEQLPGVQVRFAVKACPVDEVIATLAARGAGCDAASPNEIAQALRVGVPVEKIHYGNTSKSDQNIADAYAAGVRDFATDSVQDVTALGGHAPGSRVFCRVATTGEGALWGLSHKFGCSAADAVTVLETALRLGLVPAGLSIHVGSQQMRPEAWRAAFEDLARVVVSLRRRGIDLEYVNLGGGLPALGYLDRHGRPLEPPLDKIFATIRDGMQQLSDLSARPLRFIAEPGRYLVADHGAIRAHVQRLSERELLDGQRQHWLYLSVGKYNGLYEMDELQYRLVFPSHSLGAPGPVPRVPAVVAGPTCDSDDAFVHDDNLVQVPRALASGEPVWILSCGAYATSYTTQGFNGIDPLPYRWIRGPRARPVEERDWPRIAAIERETYSPLGLSEGEPALRAWARISPETCFVLEHEGTVAGYVLALPHPPGEPPALGRPTPPPAETPPSGSHLHLHDLALDPAVRGAGLSRLLLRRLEHQAAARMIETIGLVSVGGSDAFWAAAGFEVRPGVPVPEGYGERSVYMTKAVEVDQLAAHPR